MRAAPFGIVRTGDPVLGHLVENAIWSQWLHSTETINSLHYARWKEGRGDHEIDLVGLDPRTRKPCFAVEIEGSDRAWQDDKELRSMRRFLELHGLARVPLGHHVDASGRAAHRQAAVRVQSGQPALLRDCAQSAAAGALTEAVSTLSCPRSTG